MFVPPPTVPEDTPADMPEPSPEPATPNPDEPSTPDFDGPTIIVDVEELAISEEPTNGVTPSGSFTFTFAEDIDITDIEVSAYRSDF